MLKMRAIPERIQIDSPVRILGWLVSTGGSRGSLPELPSEIKPAAAPKLLPNDLKHLPDVRELLNTQISDRQQPIVFYHTEAE